MEASSDERAPVRPDIASRLGSSNVMLIDEIYSTGKKLGHLIADLNYLREMRKVVLENFTDEWRKKLESDPNVKKVTDKMVEAAARSDSRYGVHLVKIRNKEKEVADARADHFALRQAYEVLIERMKDIRAERRRQQQ